MKAKKPAILPATPEFENFIDLLAIYSEAHAQMATLEAEINKEHLDLIDGHRKTYTKLQEALSKTRIALEAVVEAHPEWYGKKKSIVTAYGKVSTRTSTKLKIANPGNTLILIEHTFSQDPEKCAQYVRTVKELDLEALEKLDDASLARFRITRETTETFKVEPKTIDLGKIDAGTEEATLKEAA